MPAYQQDWRAQSGAQKLPKKNQMRTGCQWRDGRQDAFDRGCCPARGGAHGKRAKMTSCERVFLASAFMSSPFGRCGLGSLADQPLSCSRFPSILCCVRRQVAVSRGPTRCMHNSPRMRRGATGTSQGPGLRWFESCPHCCPCQSHGCDFHDAVSHHRQCSPHDTAHIRATSGTIYIRDASSISNAVSSVILM